VGLRPGQYGVVMMEPITVLKQLLELGWPALVTVMIFFVYKDLKDCQAKLALIVAELADIKNE